MKNPKLSIVIIIFVLLVVAGGSAVTAVILEVTQMGTVEKLIPGTQNIAIKVSSQYGCSFTKTGSICDFSPVNVTSYNGTVPDSSAFTLLKSGDTVEATSLGGPGGNFITLAKIIKGPDGKQYSTAIIGDPSRVITPIAGNYKLSYVTVADCKKCTGTVCDAKSAKVTLISEKKKVYDKSMNPGQQFYYNGRNDNSSVNLTFIKGQASSTSCSKTKGMMMTGPQAISVFSVAVNPPISFVVQTTQNSSISIRMPNPASVNCIDKGGVLEIRKDPSGGEYGVCKFSNGTECEEWALFRGECSPK